MTEYVAAPANSQWVDSIWEDEASKGVFRSCGACGGPTTSKSDHPQASRDYENALFLTISGGYGQFTDPQDDSGFLAGWKVVICHDCAHSLCDTQPWLANLLTPASSHSHTEAYRTAHPVHYWWDYDMASGVFYSKIAQLLFPQGACLDCGHQEESHARKESRAAWACQTAGCASTLCYPPS